MEHEVEFDATRLFANIFTSRHEMNNWCKENCVGEFQGGQYSFKTKTGIFKFEMIEDAVAFKLRWL